MVVRANSEMDRGVAKMKILGKNIPCSALHNDEVDADVDIIIPSYDDRQMSYYAALSFFRFEKDLKMRVVFVDASSRKDDFSQLDIPYTLVSVPDNKFQFTKGAGKMSHSNAYSLEVGRQYCKAPYVFVCHNDVLAYKDGWLSYLHSKMSEYRLAAFLRDNIRIKAAHVSGFMYDRKFFDDAEVGFWPQRKPERDVGDDFSHHLQKLGKPFFVCPCSHNKESLLKSIHKRYGKLRSITADKCIDDKGDVVYLHMGRGTVKMIGSYRKSNRTTHQEWLKFAKRIVGV